MRLRGFALIMLALPVLPAAEPGYFPLEVGNTWVYRCAGNCAAETRAREIIKREQRPPQNEFYFLMRDGETETWLRLAEDGRLLALDSASGEEKQWYVFAPGGENYRTWIHPCNPSAKIASRRARYSSPAGEFSDVLQLTYTNTCNSAGLVEEKFVAGLGMVQRIEEVGAVRYDLISARVGGRVFGVPYGR